MTATRFLSVKEARRLTAALKHAPPPEVHDYPRLPPGARYDATLRRLTPIPPVARSDAELRALPDPNQRPVDPRLLVPERWQSKGGSCGFALNGVPFVVIRRVVRRKRRK